jgi:hypothetical protein
MSDMPEWFQITVVMLIMAVVFGPLLVGLVLMIRDTRRGYGRWGINSAAIYCPRCDTPAPVVRVPANLRQMIWGGATCAECGCEYDKWGKPLNLAEDFDPSHFRSRNGAKRKERPAPPAERSEIQPGASEEIRDRKKTERPAGEEGIRERKRRTDR